MQIYAADIVFTKKGRMKFISHLDLMRTLMRALRRSDLPVKISEGFNPHLKLSIKRALKLGVESEGEEAKIFLKDFIDPQEFRERLQRQLPEGILILSAKSQA